MKKYICCLLVSLIASLSTRGESFKPDSVSTPPLSSWQRFEQSSMGQATMISVPLIVGGIVVKSQDDHFRALRNDYLPHFDNEFENYLQYAPAAAMLGMKIAGLKSESTWPQMLTADAISVATMGGLIQLMKRSFKTERPDGTSHTSFPSGHTACAFLTATMLHHEYGRRYPWISVAGYGCAAATGFMRIVNNRHWLSDVMVGAGIGIMSAEFGYFISDLIFHKPSSLQSDYFTYQADRAYKPSFLGIYLAYTMPLSTYDIDSQTSFKASVGTSIGMEGAWFFTRNFGLGGKATLSSVRFIVDETLAQDEPIKYEGVMGGIYASLPLSKRCAIGTKMLLGFNHYDEVSADTPDDREIRVPASFGLEFGTGISFAVRIQKALTYKIFCDFNSLPPHSSGSKERNSEFGIGAQFALTF